MDENLTKILLEVQRQRELNSWVQEYDHFHLSRSFDTARTQAVHIHHIQKNETEEQPLEQDSSDWNEVLEDER